MKIIHEFDELTPDKRPQDPHGDGTGLTFTTMEHGGEYGDNMPQAILVTDAEGRSCAYVLIRVDGRVVASKGFTGGEANPRFVVTTLKPAEVGARHLFADHTSAATMRANRLRLWFASIAYVLLCALRRIGLAHTQFASSPMPLAGPFG
jgi:hypothetical protein